MVRKIAIRSLRRGVGSMDYIHTLLIMEDDLDVDDTEDAEMADEINEANETNLADWSHDNSGTASRQC